MNTVEFYAGTQSFSKIARGFGFNTFCVDWKPFSGIDMVTDVRDVGIDDLPYFPDVVWASPDCTTYSVAAGGFHRKGLEPLTDYARQCDVTNTSFLDFMRDLIAFNPNLIYFIENPRGKFRKMPFVQDFLTKTKGVMRTVWYCRYGHDCAKPTDIFTNCLTWVPRPQCFNGNPKCRHARSPKGTYNGFARKHTARQRSIIPPLLPFEIIEHLIDLQ